MASSYFSGGELQRLPYTYGWSPVAATAADGIRHRLAVLGTPLLLPRSHGLCLQCDARLAFGLPTASVTRTDARQW